MISKSLLKQIKSLEQRKFRKESGLFVAEGGKTVSDVAASLILFVVNEDGGARKAKVADGTFYFLRANLIFHKASPFRKVLPSL